MGACMWAIMVFGSLAVSSRVTKLILLFLVKHVIISISFKLSQLILYFSVPPTLKFDGAQYVLVTLPEESLTEAEDISLRFRTVHSHGILVLTSSDKSKDRLEIYLEHGAIKLTITLGSGSKVNAVFGLLSALCAFTSSFGKIVDPDQLASDEAR